MDRIDPYEFIDPDPDDGHEFVPVADEEDVRCLWCDSRPGSTGECTGRGAMEIFLPKGGDADPLTD